MSVESALAKVFGLRGEDAWHSHANPWSVYTRIPIPLMLVVAIWSRAWIGWWSLVPIGIVLAWTAINPRVFPPPPLAGPLGVAIGTWRNLLGGAEAEADTGQTSRRSAGSQRHQCGGAAIPGVGAHRPRPVDHRVRASRPDGGQAVVSGPDDPALRRRFESAAWGAQSRSQRGE